VGGGKSLRKEKKEANDISQGGGIKSIHCARLQKREEEEGNCIRAKREKGNGGGTLTENEKGGKREAERARGYIRAEKKKKRRSCGQRSLPLGTGPDLPQKQNKHHTISASIAKTGDERAPYLSGIKRR